MSEEYYYTNTIRNRILCILDKINQIALDTTPKKVSCNHIDFIIMAIYRHCLRRYQAIRLLLEHHYTDEALTIMRSLMNDAQRLIYLDKYPNKRNATVMWLWNERLSNIESLANTAERTNQPGNQANSLNFVKDQRVSLERAKQKFGVTKFLKPPKEGASMAQCLNRPDDWLDYLMTTHASHSVLSSPELFLKTSGSEDIHIPLNNNDLGLLMGVGERATIYILDAALSVASMLQWESKHTLQTMRNTIQLEFKVINRKIRDI